MKRIYGVLLLLTFCTQLMAQSVEVNPTSINIPRYANQTAITTAIPNPSPSTIVYDNSLNRYAYYNGSVWVNFPSVSGTTPPSSSSTLQLSTYTNLVAIQNISSPVEGMLVYNLETQEVFYRNNANWIAVNTWQRLPTSANIAYTDGSVFIGETPPTIPQNNALSVQGFSRLGNDNAPYIKTKLLTGTTSSTVNNNQVLHGVDASKIVSVAVSIRSGISSFFWVLPFDPASGFTYRVTFNSTIVQLFMTSNSVRDNLGGQPYSILITYTD